jgi:hypothetical protein
MRSTQYFGKKKNVSQGVFVSRMRKNSKVEAEELFLQSLDRREF